MHSIGFIETLADAHGSAWQELAAEYLAIRSAEDVLDHTASAQQIDVARHWASRVTRLAIRRRLLDLLDLLNSRAQPPDTARATIALALLGLASEIQHEGFPKAAIDVLQLVDRQFGADVELRLSSLQCQAYSHRMMKNHAEASIAYDMMISIAAEHRATRMELEGMLGKAKIAIERGNIPDAVDAVGKVIPRARRLHVRELLGRALVDRGTIHGIKLDHVAAIIDFNEALDYADPQDLRDHVMLNMAIAFREVDFPAASRDLAVYLWYNAVELEVRWHAGVLRYNLAIDRQDWTVAGRVAKQLGAANLSPLPDAEYHEALARDLAANGRFDEAGEAASEMYRIAAKHEMFEVMHRSEVAIADIDRGVVPAIYSFRPVETTTAARRKLAAVERSVAKLCAL